MSALPAAPKSAEERGRAAVTLARDMLAVFDAQAAHITKSFTGVEGEGPAIACRTGCAVCCRSEVAVSTSETLLIHKAIEAMPDPAKARVHARVETAFAAVYNIDKQARRRLKLDCPLLTEESTCGVYAARPLSCRSHVSFDLAACLIEKEAPEPPVAIPTSRSLTDLRDRLRPRHRELETAIGIAAGRYELIQSLHIMLSRRDAGQRLARGEDVLRPARLP